MSSSVAGGTAGPPGDWVNIHYHRLLRATQVYRQQVLDRSPGRIVTFQPDTPIDRPVVVGGVTVLEPGSPVVWFTLPGAWYDVGLFHTRAGGFTGVYANVLTPVEFIGPDTWSTTDLCLDVWTPDEGSPRILDEAELARAEALGKVDSDTARKARDQADTLMADAVRGLWPPSYVLEWPLERALEAVTRPVNRPR